MDQQTFDRRQQLANESKLRTLEKRKNRFISQRIAYDIIDRSYNLKEGVIKINSGNTLNHELAKSKLCYLLKKQGLLFYTECIFKNGCRADIYCPESLAVYEILESESYNEFNKKISNYPNELANTSAMRACDILSQDFNL